MSRRDSDSKRHHSKFDREPSPKRYRRDGKQGGERERGRDIDREREKEKERVTTNEGDHVGRDQRNNLPNHSKQVNKDAAADKKSNDRNEASKHSSDPTQPPRSHSYNQGSAGQVGRSSDRREAGEKFSTQSKEHNERMPTSQSREPRDDKSHSKLDGNYQRRDGFSKRKDDRPPTTRRRPSFREKKIPVDSEEVNPATATEVKSSHTDRPSERKEERSSNPHQLDRPQKQIADDRGGPNRNEARRDGFSSRARYGAGGGNGNYRGRDAFHGRQGYHPKSQTEKWKHDLYQEVSKEPIPKSEEDQIAKLEALLAS